MITRRPQIAVRDRTSYVVIPSTPSLSLSPLAASVTVSGTFSLTVTLLDGLGAPISAQVVTLTSSVPANATVPASVTTNSSGQATFNVTGVASGLANITASALSVTSAPCVITVAGAGMTLRSTRTSFAVPVGATLQLAVTTGGVSLDPVTPGAPTVTWTSSNAAIATVNSSTGVVTGVAAGAVAITATSSVGALTFYGQVLVGTYTVRDRFGRANSTSAVGTSETGQVWAATGTSVAGILSNRVYFPTPATDSPVVVDSGVTDGLFTFQLATPANGHAYYLRYTDANNYMKVWAQGGTISLNGKSAGATIGLFVWTATVRPDDLLVVRLSGNNIQVQLNNDIISSITSTGYGALTGTKVGVGFMTTLGASFGRFGEVAVRALDHAPSTTISGLVLDQPTASVAADGVLTLHARQQLSTGENVALGRNSSNTASLATAVTWSSSAPGVAAVDSATGVVSGVTAGSATITATDGTHSATCTLTVTAAAGFTTTLLYTHEPTGFTQRTDRDFSAFAPAGSPDPWLSSIEVATSNMSIVSDATAPKSPSGVLQLQYPAEPATQPVASGTTFTAGTLELDFTSNTHTAAYLCRWTKPDAAFQGHSDGANKTGEFFFNNGAAGIAHMLTGLHCHSTADPMYPGVCINGGTDYREGIYFDPNLVPTATLTRGAWTNKIEVLCRCNTIAADGTPNFDGQFYVWLNDRLVTELTQLKMLDSGTAHLTQWKPSWLWGGQGGTIAATFFVWEDHEHVSTGN